MKEHSSKKSINNDSYKNTSNSMSNITKRYKFKGKTTYATRNQNNNPRTMANSKGFEYGGSSVYNIDGGGGIYGWKQQQLPSLGRNTYYVRSTLIEETEEVILKVGKP